MQKERIYKWVLSCFILLSISVFQAWADGGYFTRSESVAISSDQRAIIIKNGDEIGMTFSSGYTGDGEDYVWIIPTPVPPAIEDVSEGGEYGDEVFGILDESTAPIVSSDGCFLSGTMVLTGACIKLNRFQFVFRESDHSVQFRRR